MILPHLSASQIQTFGNCKRLWGFDKLAGERAPSKGFQDVGKDIHSVFEEYVEHQTFTGQKGILYKPKVDAALAAGHLTLKPGQLVETEIRFPLWEGGPDLLGYIDLLEPPFYAADTGAVISTILDYKTTSDFRYAKTPAELLTNIQMVLYAYWMFMHAKKALPALRAEWKEVEDTDIVRLKHLYVRTKGATKTMLVEADATWHTVAKTFPGIESAGREMVALALGMPDTGGTTCAKEDGLITARDASEYVLATIPGNPEHCSAYGGCHFRDRCPEANSLVAIGSLFRKHESKGDIMSSSMDDLKARLNAKMNADAAPAAAAPDAAPAVQADPAATLPPDAPPRESTAAEVEAANAPANPAVAKPKRGRPPKAAQAQAAPPAPSEDATPAAPSPPATASLAVLPGAHGTPQAAEPAAPRKGPRVLYINTRPVRGKDIEATYTPAWDIWMSDLLLQLHTELKVLDYRLVEYGKGKGALTAFIKARLETAPEVCIVRTSHPEAHDFLAVAIPMAQDVIGW